MRIRFDVPGTPVAKGRPKITTIHGKARAFTPAKTVAFEGLVAFAGSEAMDGAAPLEGPLRMTVEAVFPIPASWSKRRREAAKWHTIRPDADNIGKAVGDGLNGVCYRDDSQVAELLVRKLYGDVPMTRVLILPLPAV